MTHTTATSYHRNIRFFAVAFVLVFFSACTIVKNYPKNTPFVYGSTVEVEGKFSADEKKSLENQLEDQLHDSLQVRSVSKLVGFDRGPKLFYSVINHPPVYDSLNASKSKQFMHGLLNSLGYYRDSIQIIDTTKFKGDQHRVLVNFKVMPNVRTMMDSISFNLNDTTLLVNGTDSIVSVTGNDTLQQIALNAQKESLLKKGEPFAKPLISTELTRLVDVYRNNGYLRFAFDDLVAVWDTVGVGLLRPTLDPIEQARQIQELQQRRQNPRADIEVRLRASQDTTRLTRYHVGNITVYPDLTADTASFEAITRQIDGYRVISYYDVFKPKVLIENMRIQPGTLYRQRNYLSTLNRFNSIGAWRLVTIDQVPRPGTDTVDFVVKLTPARKYLFDFNVEGSKNSGGTFSQILGSLFGLGINLGLQNRNFARAANQSSTNLRFGVELNASEDLIQSKQISLSHTISFPRVIPKMDNILTTWREDAATRLSANAANVDRKDYFNLTSFGTSWGYEFKKKNKLLNIRIPNIEYNFVIRGDSLEAAIRRNSSYNYIFNSGLISSSIANYTQSKGGLGANKNISNLLRLNLETSGIVFGLTKNKFLDTNLYRFIKMDAEFRQTHKNKTGRKEFAWRLFGGVGYELPSIHNRNNKYMPFFRQYFAGGPNSMRAWGLRRLGPGSSVLSFSREQIPDRFGDIQLEANAEYRFFLADLNGIKINSALFTDIGNVWFLRKNDNFPDGNFQLNRLGKDIAIGMGTGLRVDFGLFLIRVDYALKVKNPSPENIEEQNKWFYDWKKLTNGQLQLGVNLPF